MRRSSSTLLSLPKLSVLILSILVFSTLSFAAAPDRITGAVVSSQVVKLSAGVPRKAQPQFDQGPVDASLKLSYMTLHTVPSASQQKAINRLLDQQQDRRSPLYHKWLTPEQYADRFGLSSNDTKKITAWLQSQGFSINNVARGRNWIAFSGTAAQVENAFQTKLHNFNVDGEMHFANTTAPAIPAALSGIVAGLRGLNDFRAQPMILRKGAAKRGSRPFYYDPNFLVPQFLAPGDITTIYDVGLLYAAGIDGAGQKLAVMGRTDVYLADLNAFRSAFGLTAINCTPDVNGLITTSCNTSNFHYVLNGPDPGVNPFPVDDLPEADLDLEWSGATAFNAQIIYVNSGGTAGDVFDAYYYTIDNDLAPVITMSYGFCELDDEGFVAADEAELTKGNTEGITFMNSSGDTGAAGCDPNNTDQNGLLATGGLAVGYPASSREVTGVGGTMIPLSEYNSTYWDTSNGFDGGSALSYIPENGWNEDVEYAAFCVANPGSCDPSITNQQTAQAVIGMSSTGGGASNCATTNGSGVCTGGFSQPTWQQGLAIPGQTTAVRFSPDVSLLASPSFPGYIFCTPVFEFVGGISTVSSCASGIANALDNGVYISAVGGTSVSSPVFAGIVTLLNQYLVQNGFQGTPGLGNANPALYQIATYNQSAFQQVTTGSNTVYCSPGTPAGQPAALRCPAAVAPATEGVFGYQASNADSATGYNLVTGLGSVDANNLATAWGELLTASTTSLSPSAANIIQGQNETLTITVTPSSASGVVNLYDNGSTTAFGTATISGGTGTFSTTALPLGTNSIVGKYTGTNASSTSSAVIVNVAAPTFTWATSSTSHTVLAGQTTLAYDFTATPTGSATFTSAVQFSCPTGLPDTTAVCVFSPPSIAATAGATPVSMTITTKGPNTGTGTLLRHRADNRSPWLPLTLPIAGVVMLGLVGRRLSKRSAIGLLCVSLALLGFMVACGGGSSTPAPPPPVSVTVTPSTTAQIYANEAGNAWPTSATQQQFSAVVNNSTNQTVTWAVTGGSANGTIDATGLYTAPATVPNPATVTVTATAAADATKLGSGHVAVQTPTGLGTFTVTVTATEGLTAHSQQVTLIVQ
jgi:subtilase family serine protease